MLLTSRYWLVSGASIKPWLFNIVSPFSNVLVGDVIPITGRGTELWDYFTTALGDLGDV